jgi:hypothetical protein
VTRKIKILIDVAHALQGVNSAILPWNQLLGCLRHFVLDEMGVTPPQIISAVIYYVYHNFQSIMVGGVQHSGGNFSCGSA